LTRADYIVSSNIVRTVQVCRQAVLDARRAVAWLASLGFERIGIIGTSLGSCLSMLTSAHEPLIPRAGVEPRFALVRRCCVAWTLDQHVRHGLDGHIDLERLRRLWRPISPWSYLDRVGKTETLLVYAAYDLTVSGRPVGGPDRRVPAPRPAASERPSCAAGTTARDPFRSNTSMGIC
jgi:hypothetical protein